jgi:chloramphenicol 3-O-phosphotransferase
MSQKDDLLANAEELQDGLRKLGGNRVVALSVHKSKELIAELEEKAEKLVQQGFSTQLASPHTSPHTSRISPRIHLEHMLGD